MMATPVSNLECLGDSVVERCDVRFVPFGGYGLRLTAPDMVKIGELFRMAPPEICPFLVGRTGGGVLL